MLHAVRRLVHGTHKSLFVVDWANTGVGDPGVIIVDDEQIQMFLAAQVPPILITKDCSDK
jgi:hypothetical protein